MQASSSESSPGLQPREDSEEGIFSPDERRRLVEWLSLPDKVSAELLGGKLVDKAMARGQHGSAQAGLLAQLFRQHGRVGPGARWWLTQEVDVYLGGEGMRPDAAGWRIEQHSAPPRPVNVQGHLGVVIVPPEWVYEVLSTSTASRDKGTKRKAYQRAGIEWYWLVDLLAEELRVYQRTRRSYELIETVYDGDVMRLPPFEEVEFTMGPLLEYGRALRDGGPSRGGMEPGREDE